GVGPAGVQLGDRLGHERPEGVGRAEPGGRRLDQLAAVAQAAADLGGAELGLADEGLVTVGAEDRVDDLADQLGAGLLGRGGVDDRDRGGDGGVHGVSVSATRSISMRSPGRSGLCSRRAWSSAIRMSLSKTPARSSASWTLLIGASTSP